MASSSSSLCSTSSSGRPCVPVASATMGRVLALVILCIAILASPTVSTTGSWNDLTAGFTKVELPESDFVVQSPYELPVEQRYRYDPCTGVRTFWVYASDKPFNNGTTTNPRTEVRLRGHDYSSGVWQFEGYFYVPSGTSGASVMQIHNEDTGAAHATTLMLHVYNGTPRYYSGEAVEECVYDRWFRLNVVHDVGASAVAVYVDGAPRLAENVTPSASHYFKFGVYVQHHDVSPRVESRWRNVTVYTKPY